MAAGFPPCRTPVLQTEPWVGVGPGEAIPLQPLCCRGSQSRMGVVGEWAPGDARGPWYLGSTPKVGRCPTAPALGRLCLGLSHALGPPGIP